MFETFLSLHHGYTIISNRISALQKEEGQVVINMDEREREIQKRSCGKSKWISIVIVAH